MLNKYNETVMTYKLSLPNSSFFPKLAMDTHLSPFLLPLLQQTLQEKLTSPIGGAH